MPEQPGKREALETRRLSKSFGGPPVVRDVDFLLQPGEVHAVVGENGAGKSTLLKLIAGVHRPDAGEILIDGRPVVMSSPAVAQAHGIALIFQEPTLFPDLSAAENIFLGKQPVTRLLPVVRWREMRRAAADLLETIGAGISPDRIVGELSVAEQQLVEVATALARRARFVLMDEPTASLTPREVERLFRVIRDLKAQGASVVFVDHRLDEVFAVADRITVMRDGMKVGAWRAAELTQDDVIKHMVGREIVRSGGRRAAPADEVALRVEGLTRKGVFHDISFSVRRGEIVALAGLVGAGRTEVARAIFGLDSWDEGSLFVGGRPVRFRAPREALDAGVAYLPENRQHQGLVLPLSVAENSTLSILRAVTRSGWLQRKAEREIAHRQVERLQIKAPGIDAPVKSLSGGNQQKVLVGKLLVTQPKVLILDEPTRGVDVGAKAEIHRLISELADAGMAIVMISSDLPEVLAMADRVLVMREGSLAAELSRSEATEEAVMTAAVGALPVHAGRETG